MGHVLLFGDSKEGGESLETMPLSADRMKSRNRGWRGGGQLWGGRGVGACSNKEVGSLGLEPGLRRCQTEGLEAFLQKEMAKMRRGRSGVLTASFCTPNGRS